MEEGQLVHPHTKEHKIIGHAGCSSWQDKQKIPSDNFTGTLRWLVVSVLFHGACSACGRKIRQSVEGLLSEACWDVVRQHNFPSREQVSRLASDLREEATRARHGEHCNLSVEARMLFRRMSLLRVLAVGEAPFVPHRSTLQHLECPLF